MDAVTIASSYNCTVCITVVCRQMQSIWAFLNVSANMPLTSCVGSKTPLNKFVLQLLLLRAVFDRRINRRKVFQVSDASRSIRGLIFVIWLIRLVLKGLVPMVNFPIPGSAYSS